MPGETRRLSAIMFTDLVGFTRLAQRNEEEALRLRKEHQELVRPLFAAHGGREVKTLGDGFLVEFPSAVASVRCALEVQQALGRRNALPSVTTPLALRIGIHVGDIVEEGDDILGDAVNVASRLEPLAEPGGICISGSVFDQVRNKVTVPLEPLGPRTLKNVDYPVEVYRVAVGGATTRPRAGAVESPKNLRLAVLPFANMSPDAHDEYFADGLTDELITQTSRIPNLRVVARTSVLRYKGSPKSIREVAQDLGVPWALEGSVRKAGNQLRITVKLIDTSSEEPLWFSRYDRPMDDIFAIQDEIASQVSSSISTQVSQRWGDAPPPLPRVPQDTQDMEAYASFLHGRKLLSEKGSEETLRRALGFFEVAFQRDPRFARARVGFAEALLWLGSEGAVPYADALARSRRELLLALEQHEALAEAHSVLSGLLLGDDDMLGAKREALRARELNPSLADPYRWLAQLAAGEGRIDETVRLLEAAHQLDPVDVNVIAFLGRAYLYAGDRPRALEFWERTRSLVPFRISAHLTEYYLGRREYAKARETLGAMERLRPTSSWTETYRGMLAAWTGDRDEARRALERLQARGERGELTVFFAGWVHYALGETDEFLACMQRAFDLHALPFLELQYSRLFDEVRDDPRLQDLLRRQRALATGPG